MAVNVAAQDCPLIAGAIIAEKYRLLGELGRGGMGTVYEAVHVGIGKHVALKFLERQVERDGQSRARFLREAQTASLVESPHIVHIFDSGCTSDGTPYMVLELLRGADLRARLRREGRPAFTALAADALPLFLARHQGLAPRGGGLEDLQERLEKLFGYAAPAAA